MENIEFRTKDIMELERQFRINLINSLSGFKSVALIGTRNGDGLNNLAIYNSLFHIGANPPLFGFITRPETVERHTLKNILENRVFTVNHIREDFYIAAHQCSAHYPADVSEFDAVGLNPEFKTGFYAPFVKESIIKIGASFRQKIELEINKTVLIIAEIVKIIVPETMLMRDGYIDLEAAGSIAGSSLDGYHKTQKLMRLSHAKPYGWPDVIGSSTH